MNILIDINHPGQVHLFRNLIKNLKSTNHKVIVTTKDVPIIKRLLESFEIEYKIIGKKRDGVAGKAISQFFYNYEILKLVWKYNIKLGLGSSITIDHVSKLSGMKSFHFSDDDVDVVPLVYKYSYPFADYILSPDVLDVKKYKYKQIAYPGYHELAYLHPNIFKPDTDVLNDLDLDCEERFFIVRFNEFKAHHDNGVFGLSLDNKNELISLLNKYGRVFITTEGVIEEEFQKYQLILSPEKVHSLLYYASLFVGDSQTMTSEAAMLGTPSVRANTLFNRISYINEQGDKYGLSYSFHPNSFEDMKKKITQLLEGKDLQNTWEIRKQKMLEDKINVTDFFTWLISNFPESMEKVQSDNFNFSEFK